MNHKGYCERYCESLDFVSLFLGSGVGAGTEDEDEVGSIISYDRLAVLILGWIDKGL